MSNDFTKVADILGADNEKRLKDAITDALIQQAIYDIKDRYSSIYCIDFDDLMSDVANEVNNEVKEEMKSRMMKIAMKKIEDMFDEGFGNKSLGENV